MKLSRALVKAIDELISIDAVRQESRPDGVISSIRLGPDGVKTQGLHPKENALIVEIVSSLCDEDLAILIAIAGLGAAKKHDDRTFGDELNEARNWINRDGADKDKVARARIIAAIGAKPLSIYLDQGWRRSHFE